MELKLELSLKTGERGRGGSPNMSGKSRSRGWKRVLKAAIAITRHLL